MLQIPLAAIPNQIVSSRIEGIVFDLHIRASGDLILADVIRDGEIIITGQRAIVGAPLIPYSYLSPDGNFYFVTDSDKYPSWQRFGVTDFLLWATYAELGT